MADDKRRIEELTKAIEAQNKALQEEQRLTDQRSQSIEKYLKLVGKEADDIKAVLAAKQKLAMAEKLGVENLQELRKEYEEHLKNLDEVGQGIIKQTEEIEAQNNALSENRKEIEQSTKELEELKKATDKATEQQGKLNKAIKEGKSYLDKFTDSNISSILSIRGFIDASIGMAVNLQSLGVQLTRSTGYTREFADNMTNLTKRGGELAATNKEAVEIISSLSTGMARFNIMGESQQQILEDLSLRYKRLGVDTSQLAPVIDKINFGFGMTGEAATLATRSLERMADQVGRPLASVVKDLDELAPTLARFGRRGLHVFEQLNVQARKLGLTVKEAFDFSELFDTFQGAAEVAGRLNAQLGLQLNSVELMRASSEERVDLLRQEFQIQGINYMSMGRRQKQMIASILKTTEEGAARLLGEEMDITAFQKEKAEDKNIADLVTVGEATQALMERLLMGLSLIMLELLRRFVQYSGVFMKWAPSVLGSLAMIRAVSMFRTPGVAMTSRSATTTAAIGTTTAAAAAAADKKALEEAAKRGAGPAEKAAQQYLAKEAGEEVVKKGFLSKALSAGKGLIKGNALGAAVTSAMSYLGGDSADKALGRGAAQLIGGTIAAGLATAAAGAIGVASLPVLGGIGLVGSIAGGLGADIGFSKLYDKFMAEPKEMEASSQTSQENIDALRKQEAAFMKYMRNPEQFQAAVPTVINMKIGMHEFQKLFDDTLNMSLEPIRP